MRTYDTNGKDKSNSFFENKKEVDHSKHRNKKRGEKYYGVNFKKDT